MKNGKSDSWFTLIIILLFIITLLTSACVHIFSNEPLPEKTLGYQIPTQFPKSALPNDEVDIVLTYPIDDTTTDPYKEFFEKVEIPTPHYDKGTVTGRLVLLENKDPYLAPGLYLGNYLRPEEERTNIPQVISLTIEIDPKAIQAQDGTFVFKEVAPGKYGLIIWTPMNLLLVPDIISTKEELNIIVTAGEITDLGTIYIK